MGDSAGMRRGGERAAWGMCGHEGGGRAWRSCMGDSAAGVCMVGGIGMIPEADKRRQEQGMGRIGWGNEVGIERLRAGR